MSNLLLVVATAASGGIAADMQYLVQTSPPPADVVTISYGACESAAGPAGVKYWDTLFKQAAAEGISVFVSSGDSGASGCDPDFTTPPAQPSPNSPNYICSSSYATCVGGTQFSDSANPSKYWSSSNQAGFQSAYGYIPEGGWNQPLDSNGKPVVASSGGGVSKVIPTPSWQTGAGVPAARSGRYTPDVSFSASCHDGYFACMAAMGGSCVPDTNGAFYFVYFCGTSAAAPSMAGVAALLDDKLGSPQGNLNPVIYSTSRIAAAAFHDVTPATSGVANCDVKTPSTCNNSIPSATAQTGGQAGYPVTTGFDEVTGLGSLDVASFINKYVEVRTTPTLTVNLSSASITTAQPLTVTVSVNGLSYNTPIGTLSLSGGGYTASGNFYGSGVFNIPPLKLATGKDTLTVGYTPVGDTALVYNPATAKTLVTVTAAQKVTPTVVLKLSSSSITTAQVLTATIDVKGPGNYIAPEGSVTLTSGAYSSGPVTLASAGATVGILADSLPAGVDVLHVGYTPDATVASIYSAASGSGSVTVKAVAKITPTIRVPTPIQNVKTTDSVWVYLTVDGGSGNQQPTGTVKFTSGALNQTQPVGADGSVWFSFLPGTLTVGTHPATLVYTPDATSANIYNSSTGTATVIVAKATPLVSLTPSAAAVNARQALTVGVVVSGDGGLTPTGAVVLTSGRYTSAAYVLSQGQATMTVPGGALATGTDTLTATYTPDAAGSATFVSSKGTVSVKVTDVPLIAPKVTVTPWASTVLATSSVDVLVTVDGGAGNITPTGTLILTSGSYTSGGTLLSTGRNTLEIPAGTLAVGNHSITVTYTPDATTAYAYKKASGTCTVTVTAPPLPGFTIYSPELSMQAGFTMAANIHIIPDPGFSGTVTLTAAFTQVPPGAKSLPTLSFGSTSPVVISAGKTGNAKLTISTTRWAAQGNYTITLTGVSGNVTETGTVILSI
jgi:subtilase family serine protease